MSVHGYASSVLARFVSLAAGVSSVGCGVALMAESRLGLASWSLLHDGISVHTGLALGSVDLVLSGIILLAWFPLRQKPGVGTVTAGVAVGPVTNLVMQVVHNPHALLLRFSFLSVGIVLVALGTGLYLSADLGPGPRDGLMTGLHQATGWSIRIVRTGIEVFVLIAGFLLGGTIGVGTVLYTLSIGPLVQFSLFRLDRRQVFLPRDRRGRSSSAED